MTISNYFVLPMQWGTDTDIKDSNSLRLGLGRRTDKKKASPARVAEGGQENIETVHEGKPIQAKATLCNGHGRRAMKCHQSPETQVREGTFAIKVSMRRSYRWWVAFIEEMAHGPWL